MYPSAMGRVLIAKALVISLAQYLMTVNGISRRNPHDDGEKDQKLYLGRQERTTSMGESDTAGKTRRNKRAKRKNKVRNDKSGLAEEVMAPKTRPTRLGRGSKRTNVSKRPPETRCRTEHSERMDKPNLAYQTSIGINPEIAKRNGRDGTEI